MENVIYKIRCKIDELEEKIKPIKDELSELRKELKELEKQKEIEKIKSKIRVGSKVFVPMDSGGSGYKLTITKLEIIEDNGTFYKGGFYIVIEGIKSNNEIFYDYKCPYDNGKFVYNDYQTFGRTTREVIIKKY